MEDFITPQDEVRQEIAMAAARLIAEEGLDYPSAKNQAIKTVLGGQALAKNRLPNDQDIQNEVRAYQALFQAEHQPQELAELRAVAAEFMGKIPMFEPIIYGAAVNGTGSALSDIHLLAFSDDEKEIDYWLFNQHIQAEPCNDALLAGKSFPALAFQWKKRWFQLGVASPVQRRGLLKRKETQTPPFQTDLAGLLALIRDSNPAPNAISPSGEGGFGSSN